MFHATKIDHRKVISSKQLESVLTSRDRLKRQSISRVCVFEKRSRTGNRSFLMSAGPSIMDLVSSRHDPGQRKLREVGRELFSPRVCRRKTSADFTSCGAVGRSRSLSAQGVTQKWDFLSMDNQLEYVE